MSFKLTSAFPQIIVNGELAGGLDILKEMLESGEWDELVGGDEKDGMDEDKA